MQLQNSFLLFSFLPFVLNVQLSRNNIQSNLLFIVLHTCNIQIKFILLYDSETIKYHVFIGYIVHITLLIFIAIVKQMICWCHQISILDFVMQYFLTQGHKKGISCFELMFQNVEFVSHMIEYFFILLMMYYRRIELHHLNKYIIVHIQEEKQDYWASEIGYLEIFVKWKWITHGSLAYSPLHSRSLIYWCYIIGNSSFSIWTCACSCNVSMLLNVFASIGNTHLRIFDILRIGVKMDDV